jgi:hypothetical protein
MATGHTPRHVAVHQAYAPQQPLQYPAPPLPILSPVYQYPYPAPPTTFYPTHPHSHPHSHSNSNPHAHPRSHSQPLLKRVLNTFKHSSSSRRGSQRNY